MELLRRLYKKNPATEQITGQQPEGSNNLKVVRNYSFFIIIIGIFLIGGFWLLVWQHINDDYDRTIEENSKEVMNLTKAFAEHVRGIVTDADKDLLNIKRNYERGGISSPTINDYVRDAANDPTRNQVAVMNEQGVVVVSFFENGIGLNVADRDYFQVHNGGDTEKIYIGKTMIGRNKGLPTIPLSRRINKKDGSFGGVVVIGLQIDYFNSFYKKMDLGENKLIVLIGMDWIVRARQSGDSTEIGQDVYGSQCWTIIQTGSTNGTYITNDAVDGVRRIVSYQVMPDYPFVVCVAKTMQVVLAPFEKRKQGYILGALLFSLFIMIICGLVRQLLKANTEMTAVFESISDPCCVLDKEWRLKYINHEGAQAGFQLNEKHIGQNVWAAFPEMVGGEIYQAYHEACATNKPIHTLFKSTIGERLFDAHLYPYINGLIVYLRDVTEQKKYEADLLRMDRLNVIGEMAAGIGHEVRNPMTTVRGYLQWFNQKDAFVEHRESFTLMIEELDRANSIITDFLSLAKDKRVDLVLTDLNKIIRKVFPLLQADAFMRGNNIELELQDTLEILMDEKEMRQCILNLVGNGLDSMPNGGTVTISTANVGNQVVMTVRDRGQGMTPEVKASLWTPFFTTKDHGTGLGLPICYQIAQRHEATIEVETGPEGTAFHFVFSRKE